MPSRPTLVGLQVPLEARLVTPSLRSGVVPRPRLTARLGDHEDAAVVLVCAPAGYGKTTLVAQWAAQDPRPAAWLSLEAADDDPVTLLTHVAVAMDRIEDMDPGVFDALRAGEQSVTPLALPRLGRVVRDRTAPFVLVLDDVHHVRSPPAVEALQVLAEHIPPGSRLVLASRSEPEWPLARMRVAGRLIELDARDLEMTPAEGADLLRAGGAVVGRQEAEIVVRHTEGWAAALYLASLALREHPAGVETVETFRGRDRPLADYFNEEVLVHASADQVAFLTRTSLLRRLTAPLCDAVLEREDSGAMLRALAEANLFVSPLDGHGEWYRVHQLFADSLQEELRRTEPDLEPVLHRRASAWYAERGEIELAAWHALEGGDVAGAAGHVWQASAEYNGTGRSGTLQRWLDWFTRAQIAEYPGLAVSAAWVAFERGDGDAASGWASVAEAADPEIVLPDGSSLAAQVAVFRATQARDGARQMMRDARKGVSLESPDSPWIGLAHYIAGAAHELLGEREEARAALEEAERRSVMAPTVVSLSLGSQALLALDDGEWGRARALAARARGVQEEYGLASIPSQAVVLAVAALVAAQDGRADAARRKTEGVAALLDAAAHYPPWFTAHARIALARTHLLLGEGTTARRLLGEAERDVAAMPDAAGLHRAYDEARGLVDAPGVAFAGDAGPGLTAAETRVLRFLPTHLSFREIGEELFISRNTVKTHALSVYRKLGASSRSEAVERARDLHLVELA